MKLLLSMQENRGSELIKRPEVLIWYLNNVQETQINAHSFAFCV